MLRFHTSWSCRSFAHILNCTCPHITFICNNHSAVLLKDHDAKDLHFNSNIEIIQNNNYVLGPNNKFCKITKCNTCLCVNSHLKALSKRALYSPSDNYIYMWNYLRLTGCVTVPIVRSNIHAHVHLNAYILHNLLSKKPFRSWIEWD